jgi:hypothetical protein
MRLIGVASHFIRALILRERRQESWKRSDCLVDAWYVYESHECELTTLHRCRWKDDVAHPEKSSRDQHSRYRSLCFTYMAKIRQSGACHSVCRYTGSPGADTQTSLERIVRFQLLLSLPEVHAVRQRCEVIRCSFRLTCTFKPTCSCPFSRRHLRFTSAAVGGG